MATRFRQHRYGIEVVNVRGEVQEQDSPHACALRLVWEVVKVRSEVQEQDSPHACALRLVWEVVNVRSEVQEQGPQL